MLELGIQGEAPFCFSGETLVLAISLGYGLAIDFRINSLLDGYLKY